MSTSKWAAEERREEKRLDKTEKSDEKKLAKAERDVRASNVQKSKAEQYEIRKYDRKYKKDESESSSSSED